VGHRNQVGSALITFIAESEAENGNSGTMYWFNYLFSCMLHERLEIRLRWYIEFSAVV
jgi:hypothetical protein